MLSIPDAKTPPLSRSFPLGVLIVEDRTHVCNRLAAAVERDPDFKICGTAPTLKEGLRLLHRTRPDLVLVDLGLPDGSGEEVIRAAAAADWQCDTLVISMFGDERSVISAFQAGASGYILKTQDTKDILYWLRAVVDGGTPISPQIARHLLALLPGATQNQADEPDLAATLTLREIAVLELLAAGYKRKEVAKKLSITIGTVGTHINNVYRKLKVTSNTQAIAAASRRGIV